MNCLIVDDEEMSRRNLERLCQKITDLNIVGICENGMQVMDELENSSIDLLFLDIEMPDLSGMEMVKNLSNLPQIIFTTNRTDLALEAFEYDVTDYLAKPVTLPRLLKAVNKAKIRSSSNSATIKEDENLFIRSEGKLVKLDYDEIVFIETMDDYLIFHLDNDQKHIIHSSLKKMDEKLKGKQFLKIIMKKLKQ